MEPMSKFDHLDLDGHLLQVLLAVVETGSVTGAAEHLGVTQSAVSHLLDKLRSITGDPLFVKSGRGITPTAHAEALAEQARELLRRLQHFAHSADFDPARWQATITIAANDFQRDLLLPALAARLRLSAPGVALRIIPSTIPRLEMLRNDDCQLIISPRPPDGADIVQKRLFEDQYRVFYDPTVRSAPQNEAEYLAAEHATVVYEPRRSLDLDQHLATLGIQRRFTVMVPSFSALPAFIRGTPLLATVPGLLACQTYTGLASCPPPVSCPTLPMYAIWHVRYQQDASHRWLRAQLDGVTQQCLSGNGPPAVAP
jgi:DNA-binding transcriptional LysR family regulator